MKTFQDLELSPALIQEVESLGYQQPTPIQERAIPLILKGKDLIGQAQTGTGKTAAFALPLLNQVIDQLSHDRRGPHTLVLTPTRELAIQVAEAFRKYGSTPFRREVCLIYGGQPLKPQLDALRDSPMIIVGTPGRVIDHIQRG